MLLQKGSQYQQITSGPPIQQTPHVLIQNELQVIEYFMFFSIKIIIFLRKIKLLPPIKVMFCLQVELDVPYRFMIVLLDIKLMITYLQKNQNKRRKLFLFKIVRIFLSS